MEAHRPKQNGFDSSRKAKHGDLRERSDDPIGKVRLIYLERSSVLLADLDEGPGKAFREKICCCRQEDERAKLRFDIP